MRHSFTTASSIWVEWTRWLGDHRVMILARAGGALIFAIVMAAGASLYIPLPFTPVPITLQTFVLFVGAATLRRHYAGQMACWYIGLGLFGAPFFAGGVGGLAVLTGPTGGYIAGFVVAAFFIGYAVKGSAGWWRLAFTFALASSIIYVCGVSWLVLWVNKGIREGLALGFYPFILGDMTKIIVAASVVSGTRKIIRFFAY